MAAVTRHGHPAAAGETPKSETVLSQAADVVRQEMEDAPPVSGAWTGSLRHVRPRHSSLGASRRSGAPGRPQRRELL
jgi:hypothetical protein